MPERPGITLNFSLNGKPEIRTVDANEKLSDMLREQCRLTGTHVGCETGACGACGVLLDGALVRGCLILAVQAQGSEVTTIEGLTESGALRVLQDAFVARAALQCGFCTPGMLVAAHALLQVERAPSREQVRSFLSGNICRCTGYQAIIDAVIAAAKVLRDGG